ncbi:glycosyl transferase [Agrobacterium larrymoorei]|uniref:O-linked N-acetylglucosamine transferase, SPINDLY family protein n=1 Tax=Agrobacterium larrymoorei TaxID=160699 RepID=UPI0015749554|nr:glycosyl transferase [Agrobacterium larrymoorei]NTJ41345.1 glycosyl transferase [Agrobacterium larrymoorei]
MLNEVSYSVASKQFKAKSYGEALVTLNRLIDTQKDARTYALLAKTLVQIGMPEQGATAFELAHQQGGMEAENHLVSSIKLFYECGQKEKALALSSKLIHKLHRHTDIAYIVGQLLLERGDTRTARTLKHILMKSDNIEHIKLGAKIAITTWDIFDPGDIETARILLNRLPQQNSIRLMYLTFCREHSKLDMMEKHQPIIDAAIAAGDTGFISLDLPFFNIHWSGDEHINQLARSSTPAFSPAMTARRWQMPHSWGEKIRIGYVSSDFFDQHATMKLIRRILELHDRDRFEITLFCHTQEHLLERNLADRSLWGDIVTIRNMTDEEAQQAIRARNIDILVDLKGHTAHNRTAIFNLGAAPLQVTWIGFPGSVLNVDLDYTIGDRYVLPDSSKPHYYEKFVRMPESYQPNDSASRPLANRTARSALGLPEDAFVYASFNGNRKITPRVMELWCEILKKTPNSVIWLLRNSKESQENLIKWFVEHGIAAKRVIFMRKLEFDLHLNRIPAADLGLDTFPVNGHTTTSEQLWSGLPVLTTKGTNFSSRVSESLLHAIGAPELIAETEEDYVARALALANDPERLKEIRDRIDANRFTMPLFDAERYCKHLESAYEIMYAKARNGEEPDHFDVPALPARTAPFQIG